MAFLAWLFHGSGRDVDELARRLDISRQQLQQLTPRYREFFIPKRSGGQRRILAPDPELKQLQRRILYRLLSRLSVHPAAMGFQPGRSIVHNAQAHTCQAVVLRCDLKDFFASTRAKRVYRYFRRIGWNRPAASLLCRLCTYDGGLPQGAPTSPRLSNLVNHGLDARLTASIASIGGIYTRYADDITISFAQDGKVQLARRWVRNAVESLGYEAHHRKKSSVRRQHQRQLVTGLVVNQRVGLPRATRRWLRAVEHRTRLAQAGTAAYRPLGAPPPKDPTLSLSQLEGWRALQAMIARQSTDNAQSPING